MRRDAVPRRRRLAPARAHLAAVAAAGLLASTATAQRPPSPRDFSGVWNYATMTPLERPREFAEREALTADEAARYEHEVNDRQATINSTAGPDWWDPGTRRLTNRRTSLIVDPPNGRMPALTSDAQR